MSKKLNWYAWLAVIVVGITSCIKIIREPDVWWQIRTGQWILENNQVPKIDVFSFTYLNDPWINVKWFAEVLMATVNDVFGAEWLVLLQIVCIILILSFCLKLTNTVGLKYTDVKPSIPKMGIMISVLLMLFTINYRMNSRPEMFSHLLVIVYLYYLFKYSKSKSNWLYIIIPLQIVWTNTHEAYGMGIVLILIFLFSHWVEYFLYKQEKPLKFTLVGIGAILSSAINPNGAKMIAHPFNIFGQLSENKFTSELVGFKNEDFWQYQAFIMLVVFAVCLLFLLKREGKKFSSIKEVANTLGIAYLLIVLAFFYLSLTAFRNIPFLMIVCTPLLAKFIDAKFSTENKKKYYGVIAASFFFYCFMASNQYYNKLLPYQRFGIGVNAERTPIGAAQFLKENNINGKGFVDFLTSAYFLYELQPDYKSYIDLRDLDVFTSKFFNNIFRVYRAPETQLTGGKNLWQFLNELDDFNYVVLLNKPQFKNLNNYLVHTDNAYELVYADKLNSIYLKRNPQNLTLIDKYGFSNGKMDVFAKTTNYQNSGSAEVVSKILWPFNNTKNDTTFGVLSSYYYNYLRSSYYNYIGTPLPN